MRKIAKLLAFTLAFAMVASVMVMPMTASAAVHPNNLIDNGDFEVDSISSLVTDNTQPKHFIKHDKAGYLSTSIVDGQGVDGSKALLVTVEDNTLDFTPGIQAIVPFNETGYYYASADIKAVSTNFASTPSLRLEGGVSAQTGALQTYGGKTVTTTAWTKLEAVTQFTNEAAARPNGGGGTIKVQMNPHTSYGAGYEGYNQSHYMDNMQVYKMELVKSEDLNVTDTLQLIAPKTLALTTSNVTILDANEKTYAPSTVKYNDALGAWEIKFGQVSAYGQLKWGTDYTLKVRNTFLASETTARSYMTFPFSTKDEPVAPNYIAIAGTALSANTTSSAALSAEAAYEGSDSYKIVTTAANQMARFNNVRFANSDEVLAQGNTGKTYILSCYAKTASGENTLLLSPGVTTTGTNVMNVTGANTFQATSDIDEEWSLVKTVFTTTLNAGSSNSTNNGLYIQLQVGSAGTVYVDNVELKELKPAANGFKVSFSKDKGGLRADAIVDGDNQYTYLLAADYNGTKCEDVKIAGYEYAAPVAAKEAARSIKLENVADDYKVFLWRGQFQPIVDSFTVGELN